MKMTIVKFLHYTRWVHKRINKLNDAIQFMKSSSEKPTIVVGRGEEGQASILRVPFNHEIALAMIEAQRDALIEMNDEFELTLTEINNHFSLDRIDSALKQITGEEDINIGIEPDFTEIANSHAIPF